MDTTHIVATRPPHVMEGCFWSRNCRHAWAHTAHASWE